MPWVALCAKFPYNDKCDGCIIPRLGSTLTSHFTRGSWSPTEALLHINLLELQAVHNVCTQFLPMIKQKTIQILTDNVACMFYMNRQGPRGRSHSLCVEAMRLWNWCITHNSHITASYRLRHQNTTADALSRNFSQDHEWELGIWVLHNIFKQ